MNFNVGDGVTFELSSQGQKNQPRWRMNQDTGGSGIWTFGNILKVTSTIIEVEYSIKDHIGLGHCDWPNWGHVMYNSWQWNYSGYLAATTHKKCECGGEKTYKEGNVHAFYCPKYVKNNRSKEK